MSSHCVCKAQLPSCSLTLSTGMLAKPLRATNRKREIEMDGTLNINTINLKRVWKFGYETFRYRHHLEDT